MVTKECYFGMFSDEGNRRVKDLVDIAIRDSKDWDWMVRELEALSTGKDRRKFSYAEATDTAVMDAVWDVFSKENSSGLGEVALKYKGPWSVKRHTPDVHSPFPETLLITDCRGDMVGSVDTRREDEEDVARLTAAAPAMLLALKEIKAIIGKADHITDTIDDNMSPVLQWEMSGLDIQACLLEVLSKVEETT
tara:strand:- start:1356 stop:1934 length:579 start_codon:yes stop_codon:yes gene_type:complete